MAQSKHRPSPEGIERVRQANLGNKNALGHKNSPKAVAALIAWNKEGKAKGNKSEASSVWHKDHADNAPVVGCNCAVIRISERALKVGV